jgi:hypothetical protein
MTPRRRPQWILAGLFSLCLTAALTTPASADATQTWTVSASAAPRSDVGSVSRISIADLGTHALATPVDTVRASMDATVPAGSSAAVDVRGLRADGTWSEWSEADEAAVLPESTRSVQARLVLTAPVDVVVRSVTFSAWRVPEARDLTPADGATFKVFATREGLVGRTTANGHVITARDHFVALPSRRGLATSRDGEYTVRICTTSGDRCEWAPVWDVGPWNTKDDYWNAPRQSWPDLPQGVPEAQAAYTSGYNGGKDQSGRKVSNPAGIDLADGAFWDGLQLTGNAYVLVSYQWSGSGAWGTVAAAPVTVRSGPDDSARDSGIAVGRAQVRIECQTTGEPVDGAHGTSDLWYRLAAGKYVAGTDVQVGSPPVSC